MPQHALAGFLKGLGETGCVDGQNVTVEYHRLEGQYDRAPAMVRAKTRQTLRLTFGTKAKKRRGLSFMICRRTSSLAPAFFILGTKTVSVFA
jgi:hypothetical protein